MKLRWSLRSQRPPRLLRLPDLISSARITSASSEAQRKLHPIPRVKNPRNPRDQRGLPPLSRRRMQRKQKSMTSLNLPMILTMKSTWKITK